MLALVVAGVLVLPFRDAPTHDSPHPGRPSVVFAVAGAKPVAEQVVLGLARFEAGAVERPQGALQLLGPRLRRQPRPWRGLVPPKPLPVADGEEVRVGEQQLSSRALPSRRGFVGRGLRRRWQ